MEETEKRTVFKIGGSYAVTIPAEWFREHDIEPEEIENEKIDVVVDENVLILNPVTSDEGLRDLEDLEEDLEESVKKRILNQVKESLEVTE